MTFPHTGQILRNTKIAGKYSFSAIASTACFLQPLAEQQSQIVGIAFGKGSHAYVPYTTDIQEGDRMTIDGVTYGVKGIRAHNYGNLAHKRVLLEAS